MAEKNVRTKCKPLQDSRPEWINDNISRSNQPSCNCQSSGVLQIESYRTFVSAELVDCAGTWTINTNISRPDISLLRDHITLFADVAKDWTSGPPGDYDHFVPFLYEMNVEVRDYVVQLYVNDHNIINNPTSPEDNSAFLRLLLVLAGFDLFTPFSQPSSSSAARRSTRT